MSKKHAHNGKKKDVVANSNTGASGPERRANPVTALKAVPGNTEAAAASELWEMANTSPQVKQLRVLQSMANNSLQQGKILAAQRQTGNTGEVIQRVDWMAMLSEMAFNIGVVITIELIPVVTEYLNQGLMVAFNFIRVLHAVGETHVGTARKIYALNRSQAFKLNLAGRAYVVAETDSLITVIDASGITDATQLHNQRAAIAGNNLVHLNQLYGHGASPAEVTTLLAGEANGQTLHAQIVAINGNNITHLCQLYQDLVSSANITALLNHNANGQTLHVQIQAIAGNNAAHLLQLYLEGASSTVIKDLLAFEPDGQTLFNQQQAIAGNSFLKLRILYNAGATSAEITNMLGFEADGDVLDTQIGLIANNDTAHLNQLYLDLATSAEISNMLAIEANGQTLHAQIMLIAGNNTAHLSQLYTDGISSANISYLLGQEPDGQTLHTQVQAITGNDATHLRQLYAAGANSADITYLLGQEPDGQILHAHIQAIAGNNVAHLRQLYADALTSAQITDWLNVQPDGNAIHLILLGLGGSANLLENTAHNANNLLTNSEGVANLGGGGNGHARQKHVQATAQIYVNGIAFGHIEQKKTVYANAGDQDAAAQAALNSPVGLAALRVLDINPAIIRQTIIAASPINNVFQVRGPTGGGFPRLPLAKVKANVELIIERTPLHGLHIVTCYPT